MTSKVSRRALLAGAAASSVATATSSSAVDDPVMPLYREWVSARIEWYSYADLPGNGDWDFPESLAAERREQKAFWALTDTTPTSTAGIAALASVLWDFKAIRETEKPEIKLIRGIWRATTGQSGAPPSGRLAGAIAAVENAGWAERHV
jgi:hypothetical protein